VPALRASDGTVRRGLKRDGDYATTTVS